MRRNDAADSRTFVTATRGEDTGIADQLIVGISQYMYRLSVDLIKILVNNILLDDEYFTS